MTGSYEVILWAAKAVAGVAIAVGATGLFAGVVERLRHTAPTYDDLVERRTGMPDRRIPASYK